MDCIQSIRSAIHFMEEHLLEDITYEDAARHVYMSNYHFHRLFSMIAGMTANEYIRRRRLSLAGQELILSDRKVIDVALKYGYESPESFARAFSRFHGVTPNMARHSGAALKSFNRLAVKIILEGGTVMEYRIVKKDAFQVLARVQAFRNESVSEEGNAEIPDFWTQCRRDGTFEILNRRAASADTYGICAPVSKASAHFDYGIGKLCDGGDIPEGFRLWEIPAGHWAVFRCMGADESCIGETWDRIFREFLPGSDYDMLDAADFELYPENDASGCFCEIWIPVERKTSRHA